MYNFVILTDNTVDMPVEWLNEHEVATNVFRVV